MNRFFKYGIGLLGFLCLLFALLFVLAPKSSFAQVFRPCDTNGCTMQGNILYAGGIPTVTGTGSPTIQTGSTNTIGMVTAGASATSVVITFANGGYAAIPFCEAASETQLAAFSYVVSKTAITITQTATSGNLVVYQCSPSA